jgi:hypothetical protein
VSDVEFNDFGQARHSRNRIEREAMTGMNFETGGIGERSGPP